MPRSQWPPYQTLRSLVHQHAGRPAVIMGGGPTLPKAIAEAPAEALYISVNDHGLRLLKDRADLASRRCSYVVACDKIEERARMDQRDGMAWGLPVISRHMWADYRVLQMPAPSSGMTAAWFARVMGCSPIIITGMDLYSGATYFDDRKAKSTGKALSDREHFGRWCKLLLNYPAQYRTIGCSPLLQTRFGQYSVTEPAAPPIDQAKLLTEIQGYWVRLTRQTMISMRTFQAGERLELCEGEAKQVQRENSGQRLKSGE